MSRATDFEKIILGETISTPEVISNVDKLYNSIINGDNAVPITPKTNIEKYLAHLIDSDVAIPQPKTRIDKILCAICECRIDSSFMPLSENEILLSQIMNSLSLSEYQKVEYIEATGTQVIDTGINLALSEWELQTAIQWCEIGTRQLHGSGASGNYFGIGANGNYELSVQSNVPASTTEFDNIRVVHSHTNRTTELYVNDALATNETQVATSHVNKFLFGINYTQYLCKCKISFANVYKNNILIANLVPCYKKSDGTIGMLNTVDGIFLENAGTGTFLKGSDI